MPNPLASLLGTATKAALDLVLPHHCLGCGRQGELICPACVSTLVPLEPPFCNICADPGVIGLCRNCLSQRRSSSNYLSGIRAPFLLEGLMREAIHSFKYRNYRAAAPLFGSLMAGYLAENPLPGEVIVPVPLHQRRLRERGYNQAQLLASELGKAAGLPVEGKLLSRTRNSGPQALAIDGNLRRANTAGAFVGEEDLAGAACILVDDVCTTGSTLNACAEALAAAGAAQVWGLTLAREALDSVRPLF